MDSAIRIAPAASGDHEWCARLMVANEPWITLKRDLEGCRATLSRAGTELFMARAAGTQEPLGFILLAPYGFAGCPYIACFAVAADARNSGVGAQLLAFAERLYRERGNIFLLVSSFNSRAQQFYIRHGFTPVGELKDYIVPGHSELIFQKRIPSQP